MVEKEQKKMEHGVRKGIRGVYTGVAFRLKRLVLPLVLVVCFGVLGYLSVENALQTTGAYAVDTMTVYAYTNNEKAIKFCCRWYERNYDVTLSYEDLQEQVNIQYLNKRQMQAILERHNKSNSADGTPVYILVNENNEFVSAHSSSLDFKDILKELFELGYLEGM